MVRHGALAFKYMMLDEQFFSDTAHLFNEELGGYMRCLDYVWKHGPSPEETLRRVARFADNADEWASIRKFFTEKPGGLLGHHKGRG